MSWNYRIFRHTENHKSTGPVEWYDIREAYYPQGDDEPDSWSAKADIPCGDSVDDLIEVLEMMLRDAKKSRRAILDARTGKKIK